MRSFVLCILVLCFTLGGPGCGGGGGPSKPRMVVFRSASGPIFDELRTSHSQLLYRPGMNFASAKLFVVDGQTASASELETLAGIDHALRAGASVLFLNVGDSHKIAATKASQKVGAYVHGEHFAYLMTPTRDGVDIVHTGPRTLTSRVKKTRLGEDGVLTGSHEMRNLQFGLSDALVQRFVSLMRSRIQGILPTRDSGTDPPSIVPRYIVSVTDSFTSGYGTLVPDQVVNNNVTFFFNVYESNAGPGKANQYLIAYAQGLLDPGSPASNGDRTRGYSQVQCQMFIAPSNTPGDNGNLLTQEWFSPNASPTNSYQASANVLLLYQGANPGFYTWSLDLPATPQSIPGWGVCYDNYVYNVPNTVGMVWFQMSPFNSIDDNWHDGFYTSGLVLDYKVRDMNSTSTTQFPVNLIGVWSTASVTTSAIVMQYGVSGIYEQLHSHEKSPGIYERERTLVNDSSPDPTSITLLFGRAS